MRLKEDGEEKETAVEVQESSPRKYINMYPVSWYYSEPKGKASGYQHFTKGPSK